MDQKNFIVAIVLSVIIIMGWQQLFPPAKTPPQQQQQTGQTTTPGAAPGTPSNAPAAPGSAPTAAPEKVMTLDEVLAAQGPKVTFNTDQLLGSIELKGARIDDVRLAKQRETIDPNSPPVPVLSPVGSESPYYAEFGWSASDPAVKLPGPDTVWTADAKTVEPGKPVKLTWDNGQNLIFALIVTIDEHFLFDVKQSVENKS